MPEHIHSFKLVIAASCLFASVAAAQEKQPLHEHPTLVSMLVRNNELRTEEGLPSHRMSPELCKAAQFHARYMARTRDFRHEANLGFVARAKKFGYVGTIYENIAWGQLSVAAVFAGWKESPSHWKALKSETNIAGFGYAIADDGTTYWVTMYGKE